MASLLPSVSLFTPKEALQKNRRLASAAAHPPLYALLLSRSCAKNPLPDEAS